MIAVDPAQLHPFALCDNVHHLRLKAEDAVPEVERLLAGRLVGGHLLVDRTNRV